MQHSTMSLSDINTPPDNLRVVTSNKREHSLLVSNDMCAKVQHKLATQFLVTRFTATLRLDQYDAYVIDCRGKSISCPELSTSFVFDIAFALVDEHSYLPLESTESDTRLELVNEAELGSDIFQLRIAARLRALKVRAKQTKNSENIVRDNAFEILQTLMQYSTDWMVIKDLDHRFAMVTNRFLQSYEKSADEIIGKNDLEIDTPVELVMGNSDNEWVGYWKEDDNVIASKLPAESEHMVIHENAFEQVREQVARVPIKNKDGDVCALLVCVTQANTSKINGDTVSTLASRRNIELSPIIKKLDDDRNKAEALNEQTQSAIKRKNNFIATASHDLRQPLHAIGLFIESLEQKIVDSQQRETLSKMKQSSRDLNNLLNSILDISKLDAEAVPVNKSHFRIAPLLKSIEDEFETEAQKKSIALHINSSNSIVHTDSLLLSRILKNLISNAVKYTHEGSVNLLTEIDGENLIMRVKDTGPGIPKEQYQSIFTEYHQIQNQHTQPNFGQGLGLSIVKRLVNLLKLDMTLDSETSRGTQFTLTVPLGQLQHDSTNKQHVTSKEPLDSFKLMVIDDNLDVLEAMEEMLISMNCDAYPACNIPEALEIVEELEQLPDLLIIDYQLADGVTGDTAIEEICKAAKKEIPAIIVTGNTNSALVRKATESAFRVLNKPVNPDLLLSTISSAVKEHNCVEY